MAPPRSSAVSHTQAGEYQFADCRVIPRQRLLLKNGEAIPLGGRALDVLLALLAAPGRILSKSEIIEAVWPSLIVEENNLQVQMSALRKALGAEAITTIPKYGYRFELPVTVGSHAASEAIALPGNLPRQLHALIGRDAELAHVLDHLARRDLVSIVGLGGMGKTRLAHAAAWHRRQSYPGGVWIVDLSDVRSSNAIAYRVAECMGVPIDHHLHVVLDLVEKAPKQATLIVLDSCEHILRQVAEFAATLLAQIPEIRLLATSQELLRMPEEHCYRLGPLHVADEWDAHGMQSDGAIHLFEARAQALLPSFALCEENLPVISRICRQLDGIPLAIELAAGRLPLLGLYGLAEELALERLQILGGGARNGPARHASLMTAIEWNCQRLSKAERALLAQLGAFAGDFTLKMVQTQLNDHRLSTGDALEQLASLVDKSLVVAEAGDPPLYRLPRVLRAYARSSQSNGRHGHA